MDEHVQAIVDEVLSRLREFVGEAWVEPLRVDIALRAKLRAGESEARFFGTATATFEHTVVVYDFNLGERIHSRARG